MRKIIGDDGEIEVLCKHGIGHGKGRHTCDGCCMKQRSIDYLVETQHKKAKTEKFTELA